MSALSINKQSSGDDIVYEAVDANLNAGVVVIPSTTATVSGLQGIKVAGDAAVNVLGVSAKSCVTEANQAADAVGTEGYGYPFVDASVPTARTTVWNHAVVPVTYTAVAVAYGTRLCAAASGAVRAWVSGTDPADSIIGWCAQPGGVSASGGVALARIDV